MVGLINTIPVIGIWSGEVLDRLYATGPLSADLLILMRHRALLFGIIGLWVLAAAFRPALRTSAMLAAAVSMGGFVLLAQLQGGYGEKIRGIVTADVIGLVLLALAFVLARKRGRVL